MLLFWKIKIINYDGKNTDAYERTYYVTIIDKTYKEWFLDSNVNFCVI